MKNQKLKGKEKTMTTANGTRDDGCSQGLVRPSLCLIGCVMSLTIAKPAFKSLNNVQINRSCIGNTSVMRSSSDKEEVLSCCSRLQQN
jgi:hypothetical protein